MHQAPVYAGAGPGPAVPAVAAPAMVWVAMETRGTTQVGSVVFAEGQALPPGALQQGDRAIANASDGSALCIKRIPLRVLETRFDMQGSRRVDFADAVARMTTDSMPGGGLQLDGPASSLDVLKGMVARGLTPVTDHERWFRANELPRGDRSVYEMEVITRVLEAFVMIDQINIPNLTGCELLLRRWQLISAYDPGTT